MEHADGYYGNAARCFFLGAVAGACAGLLFAPATGRKTRERLSRKLRDTRESVTDFTDDLAEKTRTVVEKASRIGDQTVRLADEASATARKVVGSLRVPLVQRTTKRS